MANNTGALSTLLHSRYNFGKDIGDGLAQLETKLNKVTAMPISMAEERQVATLLVFLAKEETLSRTFAAFRTMKFYKLT